MIYKFIVIISGVIMIIACTSQLTTSENPFYTDYDTPFATPPFEQITVDHYLPAFKEGMRQHEGEISKIAESTDQPSFENTLEALEKSGTLLRKVSKVFDNMTSANTSEELQSIAKELSPLRTSHFDNIRLNEKLFNRIREVYEQRENLTLTIEQRTLLEKYYKEFVRGGANLSKEDKTEFRQINKELSMLSLQFGENILNENNRFELVLDKTEDLSGLPEAANHGSG